MEELRPDGSTTAKKPAESGLPETVGGELLHAKERSARLSTAGPPPLALGAYSADSVPCVCPATSPTRTLGSLNAGFLVLGLDV